MKTKTFIALALMAWWTEAGAEETFSLSDCLAYAKNHSIANRMQQITANNAKYDLRESAFAFLPSLSAEAAIAVNSGRGIDPETNTYTTSRTLGNGYGVYMNLPLFDGLVAVNTLRASKMASMMACKQSEMQEDKTALAVVRQYYNLCYYQALEAQAQMQLESDRQQLVKARKQEELGQKSGADVDEMIATVAMSEFNLIQQQNLMNQASMELKYLMNYPMDSSLVVSTPALSAPSFDGEMPVFDVSDNPRVEASRFDMEKSRYDLKRSRGLYAPNLNVSAGLSTSYFRNLNADASSSPSFSKQLNGNMGEYVSVNLTIPLFNRMSTTYSVKRRRGDYEYARLAHEQTRIEVEKEMRMAWLELNAAYQEYLSSEAQLSALNISHKANVRKFDMGNLSALELQASSSKRAYADAVAIGKLLQLYVKQIEWNYYNNIKIW